MSKIKKIVLDIDGKEIKLTPKQAKDLRDILVEMWPEPKYYPPVIIDGGHYTYPWYNPVRPTIYGGGTWSQVTTDNTCYLTTSGG